MSPLMNWIRDWRGALPVYFVVLACLLWAPNLAGPDDNLYPVSGDSAKYQAAAEGFSLWLDELPRALRLMVQGEFGEEDVKRYGFESGIIQHATSYVVGLGSFYSLFGSGHRVGRLFSLLLAMAAAGLLVAWVRRAFGVGPAIVSGILYLAWPVHPYFATAIMTEMPMTFSILLGLWALDRSRETQSPREVFLAGLVLGWLALAKISLRALAVPLLVLDLFWVWSAFRRSRGRRREARGGMETRRQLSPVRFALWRLSGLAVVVVCWGAFLQGTTLPLDPHGDRNRLLWTYRGTYVPDRGFESVGLGDTVTPALSDGVRAAKGLEGVAKETKIYEVALRTVFERDPVGWFGLIAAKTGWFWEFPARKLNVETWLGSLPPPARVQPLVVLLAMIGFVGACLRYPTRTLPAVTAGGLTLVHAFTHMVSRYNIPAIPLALAYVGFGAFLVGLGLRSVWCRLRSPGRAGDVKTQKNDAKTPPRKRISRSGREAWIWVAVSLVALILSRWLVRDVWIGFGVLPHDAYKFETLLGFLFAGIAMVGAYRFYRSQAAPRIGAVALALVLPGLFAVAWWGNRESDRDPDRWFSDLNQPGDRVEQNIIFPPDLEWRAVKTCEIALDLLPSLEGETDIVVRVNGTEVASFQGRPTNPEETFETNEYVHAVQDRYQRVRVFLEKRLHEYVEPRHAGWGMEYFPQWYRIPVTAELLRTENPVRIEIEVVASRGGGSLRLYGDQITADTGKGRRITIVPAFIVNPYYLSTYQMGFFGSDRERGDYRLPQPVRLYSPATRSEFFAGGQSLGEDLSPERGKQTGEFRIRVRTAMRGGYVNRGQNDGKEKLKPVWAVWPSADDRRVSNDDLRRLSAHRGRFITGWRIY